MFSFSCVVYLFFSLSLVFCLLYSLSLMFCLCYVLFLLCSVSLVFSFSCVLSLSLSTLWAHICLIIMDCTQPPSYDVLNMRQEASSVIWVFSLHNLSSYSRLTFSRLQLVGKVHTVLPVCLSVCLSVCNIYAIQQKHYIRLSVTHFWSNIVFYGLQWATEQTYVSH